MWGDRILQLKYLDPTLNDEECDADSFLENISEGSKNSNGPGVHILGGPNKLLQAYHHYHWYINYIVVVTLGNTCWSFFHKITHSPADSVMLVTDDQTLPHEPHPHEPPAAAAACYKTRYKPLQQIIENFPNISFQNNFYSLEACLQKEAITNRQHYNTTSTHCNSVVNIATVLSNMF